MPPGAFVHGHAQRAQVVMVTYALELHRPAIEQEALVGDHLYGADAERSRHAVAKPRSVVEPRHGLVQVRGIQVPPLRLSHAQQFVDQTVRRVGQAETRTGHDLTLRVDNLGRQQIVFAVFRQIDRCPYFHRRFPVRHARGQHLHAPCRYVRRVCGQQMYVAKEARTGVPARLLRLIVQTNRQGIALGLDVGGNIQRESVISVFPTAGILSVHVDEGMAHGSVEQELDATPRPIIRHIKFQPIPAYADKGQATRPAGVLHGFFLPVLGDGNVLPVVQITERPRDGPVVRHTDTRPVPVVVSGGHTGRVVLMGETPTPFEERFRTLRGRRHSGQRHAQQQEGTDFHGICYSINGTIIYNLFINNLLVINKTTTTTACATHWPASGPGVSVKKRQAAGTSGTAQPPPQRLYKVIKNKYGAQSGREELT